MQTHSIKQEYEEIKGRVIRMTEFKDAKRIAAGYLKDIDHCVEYKNAFVFTNSRSSKGLGD